MRRQGSKSVLVLTYWSWGEPLVQNYTLPYIELIKPHLSEGAKIHVLTLEKDGTVPEGTRELGDGLVHHAYRYHPFGLKGAFMVLAVLWKLLVLVRREDIGAIHAWCTPAGMLGYVVSVLARRRLIIDSYEPHAEAMVENGTWRRGSLAHRTLFLFEKLQTRRAWAVVSATEGMRSYAQRKYGHVPARFYVKPACVDLDRFSWKSLKRTDLLQELGLEGKLVAVYAGKFGGIYLEQEVFDLFKVAREHWGERLQVLLLTAHPPDELWTYIRNADLPASMFTVRGIPPDQVQEYLGLADWALTPVKPVPTKHYCTPIKNGEYWAMGLPVMITPNISDDSGIIERNGIGVILHSLDRAGYMRAVQEMDQLLKAHGRRELYDMIRPTAERYRNYDIARRVYREVYGTAGKEV